jgi:hypothetical protein
LIDCLLVFLSLFFSILKANLNTSGGGAATTANITAGGRGLEEALLREQATKLLPRPSCGIPTLFVLVFLFFFFLIFLTMAG